MDMIVSSAVRLQDRSNVAEARRLAREHAEQLGWRDADRGDCEIVASELATNLLKHARGGIVAITSRCERNEGVVLLVSVDQGPGMHDLQQCLKDGYSTAGSPGGGLGAVRRLAEQTDIVSTADGTVLIAELRRPLSPSVAAHGPAARGLTAPPVAIGALAIPKEGEPVNGDGWAWREASGRIWLLACDGLGHGTHANEASRIAAERFLATDWDAPSDAVAALDEALRPTRGAAAAGAALDPERSVVRFCGVGNIAAAIVAEDRTRHFASLNGILGSFVRRFAEFEYPWPEGATLVMHSDGINTRWQPSRWPHVWHRHPAVAAGLLYRDCARGTDDVVVVVVRR